MDLELSGKVAIVTGASRGIGRAIAQTLAAEGMKIAAAARSKDQLDELAKSIQTECLIQAVDLRKPESAKAVVDATIAKFGTIDLLVNNAGATKRGDFFELTDADWQDGYALKFFAHVRLTRAAWPLLQARRGSVITIGGTSGRKPEAAFTIGSSVNAACAAFSKAMAHRGKDDGVQVNCIHPSLVDTDRQGRRIQAEIKSRDAKAPNRRRSMVFATRPTAASTASAFPFPLTKTATWTSATSWSMPRTGNKSGTAWEIRMNPSTGKPRFISTTTGRKNSFRSPKACVKVSSIPCSVGNRPWPNRGAKKRGKKRPPRAPVNRKAAAETTSSAWPLISLPKTCPGDAGAA